MTKTYFTITILVAVLLVWMPTRAADEPGVRTLTGHKQGIGIGGIAFSPDGKALATGGTSFDDDKKSSEVILWDVATGKLKQVLSVPSKFVTVVAFSPDSKTLAVLGGTAEMRGDQIIFHQEVLLFDAQTGELKRTLTGYGNNRVYSIAFSPDGKTLASVGSVKEGDKFVGSEVKSWDVQTGELKRTLTLHQRARIAATFSPDGKTLAGDGDRAAMIWDAQTGEVQRTLPPPNSAMFSLIFSVALSADGKTLAGTGMTFDFKDGKLIQQQDMVLLWNVQTGALLQALKVQSEIARSLALSPDGKILAGVDEVGVKRAFLGVAMQELTQETADKLKVAQGVVVVEVIKDSPAEKAGFKENDVIQKVNGKTLKHPLDLTEEVRQHTTGERLTLSIIREEKPMELIVTLGERAVKMDVVQLWDVQTGELKRTLTGHEGTVTSIAFSPDGKTLASGSTMGTVKLWRVQ